MSVGFLAIRTIEPDRAVGFRPARSAAKPARKERHPRLHRIDAVGRAATQRVLRSALHKRIYVRSTEARHGHYSHEEGNTRLDAVSR